MARVALLRFLRRAGYQMKLWFLWRGRHRPSRMYRNGRPADALFLSAERLFFRCKAEWVDEGGRIKSAYIRFPDQSVNREKYSRPADVLLPDDSERSQDLILWGVAIIRAGDVPSSMSTDGKVHYEFSVEHDPYDDNYSHSELRVYKNKKRETSSGKVNQKVRKKYRTDLAEKTRVVIRPLT